MSANINAVYDMQQAKLGEMRAEFSSTRRVISAKEAIDLINAHERRPRKPRLTDISKSAKFEEEHLEEIDAPEPKNTNLIDKALAQHSNQDVWGKPFKIAEE